MKVLITGSEGFIGKNLRLFLAARGDVKVMGYTRQHNAAQLPEMLRKVDFIFHLAGVNRPKDPAEFITGNRDLTVALCAAVRESAEAEGKRIPLLITSSIQAEADQPYGLSKRAAEQAAFALRQGGLPVHVFRLSNVFGKWARPNYNSAIATFCYNIARGLPIEIRAAEAPLSLVYIDDVVARFIQLMDGAHIAEDALGFEIVTPQYPTTVGEAARLIYGFKESRETLTTQPVGTGFLRALYSTYLSYLPVEAFAYGIAQHKDQRGAFVEMLKTVNSGQVSYFTAFPGVTRGGHYHHSKTEKFLVIKGRARFKFRHMDSGEAYELLTDGNRPEIVETAPGWAHDITNVGEEEMIVMLWANEIFDRANPDTYICTL